MIVVISFGFDVGCSGLKGLNVWGLLGWGKFVVMMF